MSRKHNRHHQRPAVHLLVLLLAAAACADAPTAPIEEPPPAGGPADVDGYVAGLGSWEDFSPSAEPANEAVAPDTTHEEVVEEPDENGDPQPVTYVCTETPYSLTDTPRELVMYEPNASIMWVGNLIQGKSYKDGQGSFEELSIRQRAPLKLSIDLLTGENAAVVEAPSLTTVQSAIGELIQRATDAGHRSGSSIDYEEQLTYSVEQAALSLGLSARFLGAKARTDLQVARAANERTLTAHFVQKMFTISIELPQTPEAVFSDEFTDELLQQQIDAGNIGRTNLPVYIASVTYGRTLTYSLTSTHSEARLRAAIAASYNGLAGGASGYTEAELRETLGQQNIKVTAIGGEGQNVLDLISSGNLKAYFTEDAPLTSAKPLSYQLNFLGDNSIAKVSETTAYTLRTCEQKVLAPGRFEYLAVQQGAAPVATPYEVYTGDVNGDGLGDLVWNHVVSGTNETAIGLGQADGTFVIGAKLTHPANPDGGWSSKYDLLVADFTGDGAGDLLWNRRDGAGPNRIYLAVSNGDGTFDFRDELTHPNEPSWADGWRVYTGDLDNDADADLIWSYLADINRTFVALSSGDGTFEFGGPMQYPAGGWSPYHTYIGDIDADQDDDIIWNAVDATHNRTYVALSNGDGTFDLLPPQTRATSWEGYSTDLGDIDRDGAIDLIWTNTDRQEMAIHRGLGQPSGVFEFPGAQLLPHPDSADVRPFDTYIGDFNDDGSADILWNDLTANANHVWVGLGNEEGTFDFTPIDQEHPATESSSVDWTAVVGGVHVLDINNDHVDDVVWIARAGTYRIYVALGRDPAA